MVAAVVEGAVAPVVAEVVARGEGGGMVAAMDTASPSRARRTTRRGRRRRLILRRRWQSTSASLAGCVLNASPGTTRSAPRPQPDFRTCVFSMVHARSRCTRLHSTGVL